MDTLIYVRAVLINIYKRRQDMFDFIFKLYVGLLLFGIIGTINMPLEELSRVDSFFSGGLSFVLIAFVFAMLPATAGFALLAFDIAVQTSAHIELSVMLFLLMICLILFYVRNAPKESWLIILTVLGFYYRIPYIAPIIAGLYFPLTSAIPIIIGVYIWDLGPRVLELMRSTPTAGFDVVRLTETAGPAVQGIISEAAGGFAWVFTAFVFAMTVLIVYVVSHLTMDYAKELSIVFGGVLCMVGLFLVQAIAKVDLGGGWIFLFSLLAMGIMYLISFFDLALDYKKAERVEFSDDDNYYYVRVIPKLIVTEPRKPSGAAGRKKAAVPDTDDDFFDESAEELPARRHVPFEYDFDDDYEDEFKEGLNDDSNDDSIDDELSGNIPIKNRKNEKNGVKPSARR